FSHESEIAMIIYANRQSDVNAVRHECGHLVVAKCLRFETGLIRLEEHQAGAEIDLHLSLRNIEEIEEYVERRVQVLYAGVLAESLYRSRVNVKRASDFLLSSAKDDFSKVKEMLRIL